MSKTVDEKNAAKCAPECSERQYFPVAHLTFGVQRHPEFGKTFAIYGGEYPDIAARALFSGHIETGMAAQLRALADQVAIIEAGQ